MSKIKRTERGWAGHLICGPRCRFHLNTLLSYGKKKIIVSTVGNLIDYSEEAKPKEIGCDRYYETMIFYAMKEEEFIEIDVTKEISFDSEWSISEPYQDNLANDMHENAVQEIINKLEKGGLNEQ
jgi:hypothetical protein